MLLMGSEGQPQVSIAACLMTSSPPAPQLLPQPHVSKEL